jgi:hypothetical protein
VSSYLYAVPKVQAQSGGTASASGGLNSGTVSDTPKREANGQYRIGSKVQVYDSDLKPTDAYFTYSPNEPYNNAVILNFGPPYIDAALFFFEKNTGDDSNGFVRDCIDKSIEWAATAKQNNVRSLAKEISFDEYDLDDRTALYGPNRPNQPGYYGHEIAYLVFNFYIGDLAKKGKEETWLIMNYLTRNEIRSRSQGHFFCFRENDFARLKEMFSESYLAEIDKQEAAWQKSHAEQDALFE